MFFGSCPIGDVLHQSMKSDDLSFPVSFHIAVCPYPPLGAIWTDHVQIDVEGFTGDDRSINRNIQSFPACG